MNNRYREEEKEVKTEKVEEVKEEVIEPEILNQEETTKDSEKEKLEAEVKRLNDLYLRTLAETENFRKRINDERIRERKYYYQPLLEKIVSALDLFDKAINVKTDDEKLKNFLLGFNMINTQLKQIVEDEGVKRIVSLNTPFNPQYHHAIETAWDEAKAENIILEEFQTGYTFKDRVLRPALVKVNKQVKEENK